MKAMRVFLTFILCLLAGLALADETPNEQQARRIFDKSYGMVFGEQGATLHYDVNIVGIYKTNGTISFKGKKQKFTDQKVDVWNDGETAYMAYRKKRTVEIHSANSKKRDKYSSRFKFNPDDYTYHISSEADGLLITLKQKKGVKSSVKEVRALVERNTYVPKKLRVKVAFVWTTVIISNFHSGNLTDDVFVFPRSQFKDWKFVDKRKD